MDKHELDEELLTHWMITGSITVKWFAQKWVELHGGLEDIDSSFGN
jgi:hypothetical protein